MKRLALLITVSIILGLSLVPAAAQAPRVIFTVNSTVDSVDANSGDNLCADALNRCTLRAAVMQSSVISGILISVPAGRYVLTIPGMNEDNGATGDLDPYLPVTIQSTSPNGAADTIIDANGIDRVIQMAFISSLTLDGITVTGGAVTLSDANFGRGGGIYMPYGFLTLQNSIITKNTAAGEGGGVYCFFTGAVTAVNSEISENTATLDGGGLYTTASCPVNIIDTRISRNRSLAGGGGGAMVLDNASFMGGEVTNNSALTTGGGLHLDSGNQYVANTRISGNTAFDGGGLYSTSAANLVLTDLHVQNNSATGSGGGIFVNNTTSASNGLDRSSIHHNSAFAGGGLLIRDAMLTAYNTTFAANTAVWRGGGIGFEEVFASSMTLVLRHVTVTDNSALVAGNMYNVPNTGQISALNSIIWGNHTLVPDTDCLGGVSVTSTSIADWCAASSGVFLNNDPLLSALKLGALDNTPAAEPLPGSPAIGVGTTGCNGDDQRGIDRTAGACTLGAIEFNGAQELLANTSFEDDANGDKQPDSWKPKGLSGDKRQCTTAAKIIATNSGKCVLAMKNPVGAWQQKVGIAFLPEVDDEVLVAFFASTSATTSPIVAVATFKGAGGVKAKLNVTANTASSDFTRFSDLLVLSFTPTKTTVKVQWNTGGKVVIDDVSMVNLGAELRSREMAGILPPPPAPAGFRRGGG